MKLEKSVEADKESEDIVIRQFKPILNLICSNPTRAGIVHLLVNSKITDHNLSVSFLSKKLERHHSTVIYHLDKLRNWGIVKVSDVFASTKRVLWSLDLAHPGWVSQVYSHIRSSFFTEKELEEICSGKHQKFK